MIARLMAWLWEIQGLTCREAIRLSGIASERSLTFRERVNLCLHHSLCSHCRNYARQLRLLRKWLRRLNDPDASPTGMAMSSAATVRIKKRLKSECSQQEQTSRGHQPPAGPVV
jgi:hypothetical protein